ncbi:hypothetical protein L6452_35950 [Arctium lappa]|uniref:Uncharacterized protein n=1 Tax=Arctium lappa TaxID=4217 RepID=A0ACB8Y8S1_ARCLA|nr:hypothetical protein L6452_35950 [Arctium lappa]
MGKNKKGSSSGGRILSEEPLAALYSHIRCAGSLGEEKQDSPAYLPSISIGGNGKSCDEGYLLSVDVEPTSSVEQRKESKVTEAFTNFERHIIARK